VKNFISKLITLSIVSLIGSIYFVAVIYTTEKGIGEIIYYVTFMFPVVLMYMSPSIIISYIVDFIKKYFHKTNIASSMLMYFTLCLILFYIPFVIIEDNSLFAIFYFLGIPVIYGAFEFFVQKKIDERKKYEHCLILN
jgi:hypothetical protein